MEELELVVIVSVEVVAEEDTEVGENEPVVPVSRPETLSATEGEKPPVRVTCVGLRDPCWTDWREGAQRRCHRRRGCERQASTRSRGRPMAVALAAIVSVESGVEEDTEVGEKEPVSPVPRPETLSDIEDVNPLAGCNVTV